jgi:hypothetical protein
LRSPWNFNWNQVPSSLSAIAIIIITAVNLQGQHKAPTMTAAGRASAATACRRHPIQEITRILLEKVLKNGRTCGNRKIYILHIAHHSTIVFIICMYSFYVNT